MSLKSLQFRCKLLFGRYLENVGLIKKSTFFRFLDRISGYFKPITKYKVLNKNWFELRDEIERKLQNIQPIVVEWKVNFCL
jgi:hypothetical protein